MIFYYSLWCIHNRFESMIIGKSMWDFILWTIMILNYMHVTNEPSLISCKCCGIWKEVYDMNSI